MKKKISRWQRWQKYFPPVRFVVLLFFLTLDVILGYRFAKDAEVYFPEPIRNAAQQVGINLPKPTIEYVVPPQPDINIQELLDYVNQRRTEEDQKPLTLSSKLNAASSLLLQTFDQDKFEIQKKDYSKTLEQHLKTVEYNYLEAVNTAVIGPFSNEEVIEVWEDSQMIDQLMTDQFTEIGFGLTTPEIEGYQVGALVIILAKPAPNRSLPGTPPSQASSPTINVPEISNGEVLQALNQYRADHNVPGLLEDNRLCEYADKRAQDLASFGGLDGHQGFINDFAAESPPVGIKDYPGGSVGENLASQFCINATTGDSFVAETGTSLIEWCFDSSLSGHREAQLNPHYNAACVRHRGHLYVVIFGE